MSRGDPDVREAEAFELAVSTSHLLHRAQQLAVDRFAVLVGENGLTFRQFVVLAAVAKTPGVSQAELVRDTGIDRSTLADMISRMERRGWLTKAVSDNDGRANSVRLAAAGNIVLVGALQHAKAADAAILDSLTKPKRKAFLAALDKLSRVSDEADAKVARKMERDAKHKARAELKAKAQAARARGKGKRKRKSKAREKAAADKPPRVPV